VKELFFLADTAATDALGSRLAQTMPPRAVVFLHGDLGAGKSSLARAMLRCLGVAGAIRSPTFTLVERYQLANGEAAHLDLYRIAQADELEFIGVQEISAEARLLLVEWPERAASALPPADLEVRLAVAGCGRSVGLRANSPAGLSWLNDLSETAPDSGSA
jgi:tRNA threonylcarbamoyladenosine biosynthesis protein TsaE